MARGDNLNGTGGEQPSALRLAPDMASLRLLVLAFVRDYFGRWDASPSYGEIANALETNRTRVRKAVNSLAADRLLLRSPGPRGLRLPDTREKAVRELRALGWQVDEGTGLARAPLGAVTNGTLLPPPALDYIPDQDLGGDREHGGEADRYSRQPRGA